MIAGANLAKFWERRGERVFEMYGIYWAHKKGPFFSSLPFDLSVDLHPDQIDEILRRRHIGGLRFPVSYGNGLDSGLYVCPTAEYSLQSVNRKQRGHIRAGLEHCEIRRIDAAELASQGLDLNHDTLGRQGRADDTFLDRQKWHQFAAAVGDSPGMMVWGAFVEGRLSTYIIGCREGEWLHLMYKASRTADLNQYANHALDFSILTDAAHDSGIRMVSSGATSLQTNEGLDRYKRQLGYTVLEQKHAVHFHPLFESVLAARVSVALGRAAAERFTAHKTTLYVARMMEGASMTHQTTEPGVNDSRCQQEDPHFSRLARPGSFFPILRVAQTFRRGGIANTAQRAADFFGRKARRRTASPPPPTRPFTPDETLNLQAGEWIEVRPAAEIQSTLDARGKNRGLLFTDEMKPYIGQRFRVHKRVESIFLEESKQRRTIKNTVLLEGSFCQGKNFNCDRSCFLFWKEVWLRRV